MLTMLDPYTGKDWLAAPEEEHGELIHGNLLRREEMPGNCSLAVEIIEGSGTSGMIVRLAS